MARKHRVLADISFHHVIQRGNNRRRIFDEEADYLYFKSLIKRYIARYQCRILHYCFMSNHVHLIVLILKGADMPKFLQGLNLSYCLYYKRKYGFTGSLWQGRYKNFPIEKDSYLLECARYIERNPLRANMVEDISKYPYSSYSYYANGSNDDIITANIKYEGLGRTALERQKNYISYVNEDRFYEKMVDKTLQTCPRRT